LSHDRHDIAIRCEYPSRAEDIASAAEASLQQYKRSEVAFDDVTDNHPTKILTNCPASMEGQHAEYFQGLSDSALDMYFGASGLYREAADIII
jgi:hypothetical protein